MPIPARFPPPLLSLFRAVFGLMFLAHGVSKFFGLPPFPMPLNPLLTTAGVLELVGGTLLFVGLFTRPVAFLYLAAAGGGSIGVDAMRRGG